MARHKHLLLLSYVFTNVDHNTPRPFVWWSDVYQYLETIQLWLQDPSWQSSSHIQHSTSQPHNKQRPTHYCTWDQYTLNSYIQSRDRREGFTVRQLQLKLHIPQETQWSRHSFYNHIRPSNHPVMPHLTLCLCELVHVLMVHVNRKPHLTLTPWLQEKEKNQLFLNSKKKTGTSL